MTLIPTWKERYLFGLQTSAISGTVTFDGTATAEEAGKAVFRVKNNPHIDPGFQLIDSRKAVGISVRDIQTGAEFQSGLQRPTVTVEFDVTPNLLKLFLWLLFQKGTTEDALTPFVTTCIPYTTADAEVWASLVYLLSTSTAAENTVMHGAVCRNLTISSAELAVPRE